MTENDEHVAEPEGSEELPDDGNVMRLSEQEARAFVAALSDPPLPPEWLRRAAAEFLESTGGQ